MTAFMRELPAALTCVAGLDALLERLASSVARLTLSDLYLVAPYSPETGTLVAACSSDPDRFANWSYPVLDPQKPFEKALRASLAPLYKGPILAAMLRAADPGSEFMGVIALGRGDQLGRYEAADSAALDLVAAIAALAVSRFRARLDSSHLAGDQALVARLVAHATAAGSEDSVYQSAVDTAIAILGLSGCALFLAEPGQASMTCVATRGDAPAEGCRRRVPSQYRATQPGAAYADCPTIPEDDRHLACAAGPGAFIVGLARPGRIFDAADRQLFTTLARSIGIMVDSAIATERERDRLRKTEMLLRLAHAVGSKTGLDSTLEAAGDEARRMLGADCVSVFTIPRQPGDHQVARMSHSSSAEDCPCGHVHGRTVPIEWLDRIMFHQPTALDPTDEARKSFSRHARTVLVAPLHANGTATGGLIFCWRGDRTISHDILDFAGALSEIAALAIERARLFEDLLLEKKVMQVMNNELAKARDEITRKAFELKQMYERIEDKNRLLAEANRRLEVVADRDGMTGVANHRSFQERLRQEMARASRHKGRLSLIMLDVDRFKLSNDDFGHPHGDEVLRMIAETATRSIRPFDFVARYGGEEFAVILPRTGRRAAKAVAERIRKEIERTPFPCRKVTASLGVSTYPSDAASVEELVAHADEALYAAKAAGRNRVVSWTKASSRLRRAA
jgi:diguanylate cyclase (GGDEF)-like protein